MRLAIFWSEILHYHAARIKALMLQAEARDHTLSPFTLRPSAPGSPVKGYQDLLDGKIAVLSEYPNLAGLYSRISQSQVIDFLNRIEPDVVGIPGYSSPAALAALEWCRRSRRGAILMSDSKAGDHKRHRVKEYLKSKLVSCFDSALVAGRLQSSYVQQLGIKSDRIFIGYDAVDNEFWSNWSETVASEQVLWRKQLGLPLHYFLAASRLVPKKNVAGLLKAYALYIRLSSEAWPLIIVGDGGLRVELEDLANRLEIAKKVQFVGYLAAENMAPYYALASMFVLASSNSEQWGLVVNEAMASGTPVVVSNICGSAAELVVEGKTGFSFDPADEEALAKLFVDCTHGRFDLKGMGVAARAHVERFSPRVFAEGFLSAAQVAVDLARARTMSFTCRQYITAARSVLRERADV